MLAARLSRVLVGCYPRRWRERYGEEVLDVLDQHRSRGRTVLTLAVGALSTHLDPSYRMEGLQMNRVGRYLRVPATVVLTLAVPFGAVTAIGIWQEAHPGPPAGGSDSMAFASGRPILSVAASGPPDGTDTLWDVSTPARPRRLVTFKGGAPTAFAPGGRVVSTISATDAAVLWNVTNLRKPARISTLPVNDGTQMWGAAFSPDGRTFAAAYLDRLYLWDVANPARPKLLRTLNAAFGQPATPAQAGDIAFSPDGKLLATTAGRDHFDLWDVADPADATLIATVPTRSGFVDALAFSPRGDRLAVVTGRGIVTMYSLTDPANPALTARLHTVTARQIAATVCEPGGCAPDYALAFAPDGRTLIAVADLAQPSQAADGPNIHYGALAPRAHIFTWNVTNPRSARLTGVFNHPITIAGDSSNALVAPSGRAEMTGASLGFKISFWTLP
jgi:hypothetical protein